MTSLECQMFIALALVFLTSCLAKLDNGRFPFYTKPTFVRITFEVPLNFSSTYGKIEPLNREWFILFEIDHTIFPSTYPAINEEIQAGDAIPQCRRFDAVREVEIELELHSNYVRLRCGNSERYEFPETISIGHEFLTSFFVQENADESLCAIDVNTDLLKTSRFSLPLSTTTQMSLIIEPWQSDQKTPSRRMLSNLVSVTQSSKLWTGKVRFATYKMHQKGITKAKPENGHSYIDIQKDRKVYEAVQRSTTRQINSVWSTTFLVFLTIEVIVISCFIAFGLTMFVLLQIRPKTNKHVEIVF